MGKKKGGKKHDDYWDQADVGTNLAESQTNEDSGAASLSHEKLIALLGEEEEGGGLMSMISRTAKKKEKKKKKPETKFDDDVPDPLALGNISDDELESLNQNITKKKGKNSKKNNAFSFDALNDFEEEDDFNSTSSLKNNRNKGMFFDSLEVEDEDVPIKTKSKFKKDKKKTSFDALEDEVVSDKSEEKEEVELPKSTKPEKKGKKGKKNDDLDALAALIEDDTVAPIPEPVSKGKKGKGKKGKKDDELDALAALIEDDTVAPIPEPVSKGKKGKGKKGKKDDELDALAALIEDDSIAPIPEPPAKGKKGKGKKKQEFDLDEDLYANLDTEIANDQVDKANTKKSNDPNAEEDSTPKIKSSKRKEKERKERQKAEKKRLEELKKAQEPALEDTLKDTAIVTPEVALSKGKGKKKGPGGAIEALRKQLEAQKALEEEARRREEEERKKIEEEEKRLAEEERLKEEARLLKKQKEAEKREQLRKEGKLLTKAQKEAKKKAELRREALIKSGMVQISSTKPDEKSAENVEKPKRILYGVKKRPVKKNTEGTSSSKSTDIPKEDPKSIKKPVEEEDKNEIKESWDDSDKEAKDSKDDIKENWDDSEDDKKNVKESWEDSDEEDKKLETKESWEDTSDKEDEDIKKSTTVKTSNLKPSTDIEGKEGLKKTANGKVSEPKPNNENKESESDDDSEDDSDDSDEELSHAKKVALQKKREASERRNKRIEEAMAARSKDDLRSPIACILGHVDTGKTKLLDKIRQTNVQEGEAGGITQQIGATYFPIENIIQKTSVLKNNKTSEYNLPGLLVIDTPGHESFTNLRSRGSSLCNIAILVVDIMHGLEPQTLESIRLLRQRKTPFIVALNKIDRIYGWKPIPNNGFLDSLSKQGPKVKEEFDTRVQQTIVAFAEQGLNAKLYYENKNFGKYVSFVPTSAITGEGIPDILDLLVTLTQTRLTEKLMYVSELECTVLEVKVIEGLGTTIDVVLSNGYLNEGDRIVVCGLDGPIVTQVRALLTPQPLKELRVKSAYVHHKRVKAALGVKISAPGLERAIAGSRLLVVGPDDDEEELMDEVMEDLQTLLKSIDTSGRGVSVQASTLGSLEALLEFLRVSKIPVSAINIGPVYKKDIIRCSTMLEKQKEFAVLLAFDVEVDKDASALAEQLGVKIFTADIIYHLFDQFTAYSQDIKEQRRKDQAGDAIFPCVLKMIPGAIFSRRDPILFGADVLDGALRIGTPICVVHVDPTTKEKEIINLGTVTGIENNHKPVEIVKKGQAGAGVAVKIECGTNETPKLFGRHFTDKDLFYSQISRKSIDVLKSTFREDVTKEEWALIVKLKKLLDII